MKAKTCFYGIATLALVGMGLPAGAGAGDRGLFVGLDVYRDERVPPTPGGAEDARSMAVAVREIFEFPEDGIRLLTDAEATAERIVAEFESWLIEGTDVGDRVFFHYAGHGSQLPDDDGDEEDRFDETLAPYDVDPVTGAHQIRDDVLDGLIARLSGRRAVLVFDSCHSGTMTRGEPPLGGWAQGGGARYLPRPDQFEKIHRADSPYRAPSGEIRYLLVRSRGAAAENVLDDPGRIARMSGIVAVSAAEPGQLAYPVETERGYRGALSYLFEHSLRGRMFSRGLLSEIRDKALGEIGSSLEDALHRVKAGASVDDAFEGTWEEARHDLTVAGLESVIDEGMEELRKSGRLQGHQRPRFEVMSQYPLEDEPLFGDWEQEPAVAFNNPVSSIEVSISTRGNRKVFRRGDNLEFQVGSNRDGYLYLLVFSRSRRASCLFPNREDSDNRMRAGKLRLPRNGRYLFPVEEPYGRDVVIALLSERRLPLCEKVYSSWDEVFRTVDLRSSHAALRSRSARAVGVRPVPGRPDELPGSGSGYGWQSASLVLETAR